MYNAAVYILSFVFVLGVLIFVHELGHFLAAKYFKVRILTFSLGFGKRLVGFERGGTDYRVSVLPVGGYVRMAGEYPTDESVGAPDEFLNKPRWQRLIVGVAGATMNLIMAVLILAAVFRFNYLEPMYLGQPVVVGSVAANSAASAAGLEAGDRITKLNAKENPNWHDLETLSITNLAEPVAVTAERNGRPFSLTVTPRLVTLPETGERISDFGIQPTLAVQVRNLVPGFPAAKAGVQDGDLILKIGDHPITKSEDFSYLNDTIHKSVGKPLLFVLQRGNDTLTKEITPVLDPALGYGRIGFRPDIPTEKMNLGVVGSIGKSVGENVRIAGLTFKVLGQLVTGKTSPKTLVGPIGIFKVTGEAAKTSASDLFHWMSFISLQLGIFNLLPIPVLDGGMVFVLLIESALRRDLGRVAKERLIQVGFVFLMLLMVYVIYNDAMRYTPWVKGSGSTATQPASPPK
ncbi:MAG: RIP metalloprotease RseP [Acidobacteriia bacterium]|nr:RIP metalloprotease RseP [Terriglobia bacterium]